MQHLLQRLVLERRAHVHAHPLERALHLGRQDPHARQLAPALHHQRLHRLLQARRRQSGAVLAQHVAADLVRREGLLELGLALGKAASYRAVALELVTLLGEGLGVALVLLPHRDRPETHQPAYDEEEQTQREHPAAQRAELGKTARRTRALHPSTARPPGRPERALPGRVAPEIVVAAPPPSGWGSTT